MHIREHTTVPEEIANAITHGVGVVASIVGFVFLLRFGLRMGEPVRLWSYVIFGSTLIALYLASTLFHSLTFTRAYRVFKAIDYSAIALLIAGSYTPIALLVLRNNHGIALLITVWFLALLCVVWRLWGVRKDLILLIAYLCMGWIALFFMKPLSHHLSHTALITLIAGGLSYTIGSVFFRWEKLPFNHSIWHLWVMGGSMCHLATMFLI